MKAVVEALRDLREECRDWQEALSGERPSLDAACEAADAALNQSSCNHDYWSSRGTLSGSGVCVICGAKPRVSA